MTEESWTTSASTRHGWLQGRTDTLAVWEAKARSILLDVVLSLEAAKRTPEPFILVEQTQAATTPHHVTWGWRIDGTYAVLRDGSLVTYDPTHGSEHVGRSVAAGHVASRGPSTSENTVLALSSYLGEDSPSDAERKMEHQASQLFERLDTMLVEHLEERTKAPRSKVRKISRHPRRDRGALGAVFTAAAIVMLFHSTLPGLLAMMACGWAYWRVLAYRAPRITCRSCTAKTSGEHAVCPACRRTMFAHQPQEWKA